LVCPWYKHGLCTSPKLPEPTEVVTSPTRCLGDESAYKSCSFYVEPGSIEAGSKRREVRGIRGMPRPKVYAPIHAIPKHLKIGCPFAKIVETEDKVRAVYCEVLGRLLTRYEAELCASHWRDCPYREIGAKVGIRT